MSNHFKDTPPDRGWVHVADTYHTKKSQGFFTTASKGARVVFEKTPLDKSVSVDDLDALAEHIEEHGDRVYYAAGELWRTKRAYLERRRERVQSRIETLESELDCIDEALEGVE